MSKTKLILINPPKSELVEKKDLNGEKFLVNEAKGQWIDENTFQNSDGTLSSKDPNMVMREVHNQGNEDIYFLKMHPSLMGADTIMITPDNFAILPHAYYIGKCKSGAPLKINQLFGKAMMQHSRSKL